MALVNMENKKQIIIIIFAIAAGIVASRVGRDLCFFEGQ